MTQRILNNGVATLNGAITAGATSITISGSTLPTSLAAGEVLQLVIDSEVLVATAITSTTATVQRGQEGTTAASHASGVPVRAQVTAGVLTALRRVDDVGAAVPTGGADGDMKKGGGLLWVNDGGVWKSATLKASGGGTPIVYPNTTTLVYRARPTIPALPGYLTPVVDPTWGTHVIRITNVNEDRHAYSRIPAFNSDGTRIMMDFGTVAHHIIDATTYANLATFTEPKTAIWSNTDPNKIFGCQGAAFVSVNATTGTQTTIRTFTSADIGGVTINDMQIGAYEGAVSDDDRIVVLTFNVDAGANVRILTYDIVNNAVIGQIAAPSGFDNAQCSRLGNYVIVVAGGTRKYVPNLSSFVLISTSSSHGDNALNAGGEEIYVCYLSTVLKAYRLSDNVATNIFPGNSAFQYGHISGRARNRPGWIYLSVYDNTATAGYPGMDQVVAAKTDGSGQVQVFGFTNHTDTSRYPAQPHACPNPNGDQVVAASEWGATNVYDYIFKA